MEKHLARYCYWIGLACVLLSLVWRISMMFSVQIQERMGAFWYSSFWRAGVVFLVVSVASVNYAWLKEREKKTEKPADKTLERAA